MGYNGGNVLRVKIINATVYNEEWTSTYYVYDDVRVSFQESFEFVMPGLHELLFNEVAVLFYSHKNKLVGLAKIKLKEFLTDGFERVQKMPMYDKSYIEKSDFYDEQFQSVGSVELEFSINPSVASTNKKEKKPSILNLLIPEGHLEMYRIAYRIFTKTNRGSFICKVYWFLGFIYATYYYTYLFGTCECSTDCKKKNIINSKESPKDCKESPDDCIGCPKESLHDRMEIFKGYIESFKDNVKDNNIKDYMESFKDNGKNSKDHIKDNNNIASNDVMKVNNNIFDNIDNIISLPGYLHDTNYINTTNKPDCFPVKEESRDRCDELFCFKSYDTGKLEDIEEAIRCLQYAAASFGDAIVTWNLDKVRNMDQVKNRRMRAILERIDGIEEEDVIVDYPGEGANLGFLAFIKDGELVVSFRGTVSVDDMILDLNCEYTEFQDGYTHRGIKDLVDTWISEYWTGLEQRMLVHGIKRLLLTGYSLGGAAAVLAYLRLQEMGVEKHYVINSMTFGNPPVVSENIAKRELPNVKIFFYECDFISRLSYGSVQDAKYMCISLSSMCDYFASKENIVENMEIIRHHLFSNDINTKLYHIGLLIHVKQFSNSVLFKRVDYKFFKEIILSRNSFFDHFLHRLLAAFKTALENIKENKLFT